MLYSKFFENRATRKYISVFGQMFRKISVSRKNSSNNTLHREIVPIAYANKDKYVERLMEDGELNKEIAMKLPRMSFEMTSVAYDAIRKKNTMNRVQFQQSDNTKVWTYEPTPYDINFSLSIYAKSQTEMYQILEQIVPAFTPSRTEAVRIVDDQIDAVDCSFSLVSIAPSDTYEGQFEERRMIIYELDFTCRGFYFGPMRSSARVRAVLANMLIDPGGVNDGTILAYGTNPDDVVTDPDFDGTEIPGLDPLALDSATSSNTISITQGSAFSDQLTLVDENDDPVDLTGKTVGGWVRDSFESTNFTRFAMAVNGDPTNGTIDISLNASQTASLALGRHIYEIETDDGSYFQRVEAGYADVNNPDPA